MTRRWTAIAALALVVVVAAVVTATMGGDGTASELNVTAAAGLDGATSLEISVPSGDGAEQWITITDGGTVGRYATLLDRELALEEAAGCATVATMRFYTTDGAVRTIDVACDVEPRLLGEDAFWEGRSVAAPTDFMRELEGQLSLLP